MEELKFRNLRADELDVRVGEKRNGKMSLQIYKDARVDANILDETVGRFNWSRKFERLGETLFCTVGIYSKEHNALIYKEDAGAPSNFEKEKGEASDAFKRACFGWGIGRSLYTAPKIMIPESNATHKVSKIDYDENGRICGLQIVDWNGKVVYDMNGESKAYDSVDNVEVLRMVCSELKKDEDVDRKQLLKFYNYYEGRIGAFNNVSAAVIRKLWNKWLERV